MDTMGKVIIAVVVLASIYLLFFGFILHIRTVNLIKYVRKHSNIKRTDADELWFTSKLKLAGLFEVLCISVLSTVLSIQCYSNNRPSWTFVTSGSLGLIAIIGCILYILYYNTDIKKAKAFILKKTKAKKRVTPNNVKNMGSKGIENIESVQY